MRSVNSFATFSYTVKNSYRLLSEIYSGRAMSCIRIFCYTVSHSVLERRCSVLLRNPVDQMVSAVGAHDGAHLVLLQRKGSILEGLLHHSRAKKPKVAVVSERAAIAPFRRVFRKDIGNALGSDRGFILLELGHGVFGTQRDLFSRSPADRVAAV